MAALRQPIITIENASTAFGISLPNKALVYDNNAKRLYQLSAEASNTATLADDTDKILLVDNPEFTLTDWKNSVLDRFDPTSSLPATPTKGDRYLATATANGWTIDKIYQYNGSTWVEDVSTLGTVVFVEDEEKLYYKNGSGNFVLLIIEQQVTRTIYVDKNNSNTYTADGSLNKPYKTIQAAIDSIGAATDTTTYQQKFVIQVASGDYSSETTLTFPHRAIEVKGQGIKLNNIVREIADEEEFGISSSTFRATLSFVGSNSADVKGSSHRAKVNGIWIAGSYVEQVKSGKTGLTTHDTVFNGCLIDGDIDIPNTVGQSVTYFLNSRSSYTTDSVGGAYLLLQECTDSKIDGDLVASGIVNVTNSSILGDITTGTLGGTWLNVIVTSGKDLTVNASQSLSVDSVSYKSFNTLVPSNTVTLTKLYQEQTITPDIESVTATSDGQTVFTTVINMTTTLIVFVGGIQITEFTRTDANTLTLTNGVPDGTIITVVSYK